MSLLTIESGYRLHICPICTAYGTRRDCEKKATQALITEAFGHGTCLSHTPEGAPLVSCRTDIRISLSHSKSSCLLAISECPYINIGVDIEAPRRQLLKVTQRFLSSSETMIADRCEDDTSRLDCLLRYWTAKEAVYKAALTPGLALTEIEVAPDFKTALARQKSFRLYHHPGPDGELICVAIETEEN